MVVYWNVICQKVLCHNRNVMSDLFCTCNILEFIKSNSQKSIPNFKLNRSLNVLVNPIMIT